MCLAREPNLYGTCTAPKDSVPFQPSMFRETIDEYPKNIDEDGKAFLDMSLDIRNRWFEIGLNLTIPKDSLFSNAEDVVIHDERLKTIVRSLLQDVGLKLAAQQYKQAFKKYSATILSEPGGDYAEAEYERTEMEYLQVLARAVHLYYPVEMQKIIDMLVDAHKDSDLELYRVKDAEHIHGQGLAVTISYRWIRALIHQNWPKEIRFMLPAELLDWVKRMRGYPEENKEDNWSW